MSLLGCLKDPTLNKTARVLMMCFKGKKEKLGTPIGKNMVLKSN